MESSRRFDPGRSHSIVALALTSSLSLGPGINDIVREKRRITADTTLRLGKFFGNTPQFWLGLQAVYDLDLAEDLPRGRIEREVRPYAKAG